MNTNVPGPRTLDDEHAELLHDAIAVTERAALAVAAASGPTRLFVGMQIADLNSRLEELLARLSTLPEAFEAGWRAREAAMEAPAGPALRLVAT